ncbi:unnamed protein product [Blepharisma stoltei]|uniref:non-specific serine/threonine protein kinase n=1 Tax=Blepharisma stoltei TaxID=1481888 RepID=A0AAU9JTF9_9CILI|nr:unnamed protein product [Blepharisma stoltei]
MGNCCSNQSGDMMDSQLQISPSHFQFNYIIGRGGLAKVWKAMRCNSKKEFAIKVMPKVKVLARSSINSILNEMSFLSTLRSPSIVNMHYAFYDSENLYLVLDLMPCGDLRFHLSHRKKKFSENQSKFLIANIVRSLVFIHGAHVIHRDLKPENLLFDEKGYLHLTDFGTAINYDEKNGNWMGGTPQYAAPEMLLREEQTIAIDYYALGVILYELMTGKRPYEGKNWKEMNELMKNEFTVKESDLPAGWSSDVLDLVNNLLRKQPEMRLGFNGPEEVKSHPWLRNIDWTEISNGLTKAPFLPNSTTSNFNHFVEMSLNGNEDKEALHRSKDLLKDEVTHSLFSGFYYNELAQYSGSVSNPDLPLLYQYSPKSKL